MDGVVGRLSAVREQRSGSMRAAPRNSPARAVATIAANSFQHAQWIERASFGTGDKGSHGHI